MSIQASIVESSAVDKRAPMASAPMKYRPDGEVDWGNMWDAYCLLASEGGPPHRGTMLYMQDDSDPNSEGYQYATREIIRGIKEVSGLAAQPAEHTGWIAVRCESEGMAKWVCENILLENVEASYQGATLFVPVGQDFTLKGEIKNVITAVAKTTHYWAVHYNPAARQAALVKEQVGKLGSAVKKLFGR